MDPLKNRAVSIYEDLSVVIEKNPALLDMNPLHVAKFFLTNVKQTCQTLTKGRLKILDPIVGEDSCQIRAGFALDAFQDKALISEAKELLPSLEKTLSQMNGDPSRDGLYSFGGTLIPPEKLLEELAKRGFSCLVSEKMSYLLRSHLLTVGKFFSMTPDGRESSGINFGTLREALKSRLELDLIEKIVHTAREKIASMSIEFLQNEVKKLPQDASLVREQLQNRCIRTIQAGKFQLRSSCAFYNLKAILLLLCNRQVPILLREHVSKGQLPRGFYFRSLTPGAKPEIVRESLEGNQGIFVIECFFSDEQNLGTLIEQRGLVDLVLANVAVVHQYSKDDDFSLLEDVAQQEILSFRTLGKELGCDSSHPTFFRIAHIHAATVKEEKVRRPQ